MVVSDHLTVEGGGLKKASILFFAKESSQKFLRLAVGSVIWGGGPGTCTHRAMAGIQRNPKSPVEVHAWDF